MQFVVADTAGGTWAPGDDGIEILGWYDASTETTYADGDGVTIWHDRSGRSQDLTGQAGSLGGTPPNMVVTSTIGGGRAIQFDAVGGLGAWSPRFLFDTTFYNGVSLYDGGISFFAVAQRKADPPPTSAKGGPLIFGMGDTALATNWPWSDGHIYEAFGTSSRRDIGNLTPSLANPRFYSVHSAPNDYRVYLDASAVYTSTTNTVLVFNSPGHEQAPAWRIGDSQVTTTFLGFDGWMAEIIIVNGALTTGQRQKFEGYLAHKWGQADNLPVGHPYKTSPP